MLKYIACFVVSTIFLISEAKAYPPGSNCQYELPDFNNFQCYICNSLEKEIVKVEEQINALSRLRSATAHIRVEELYGVLFAKKKVLHDHKNSLLTVKIKKVYKKAREKRMSLEYFNFLVSRMEKYKFLCKKIFSLDGAIGEGAAVEDLIRYVNDELTDVLTFSINLDMSVEEVDGFFIYSVIEFYIDNVFTDDIDNLVDSDYDMVEL